MRTRRSQSSSDPVPRANVHRPSTLLGEHKSVLLHEALEALEIQRSDVVIDATLGGAGHAKAIVEKLGTKGVFIGIDADTDAVVRAQERLAGAKAQLHLVKGNFRDLQQLLDEIGVKRITKALFDLGWSSYQLDSRLHGGQAGRGFSFQSDGPLLMTYMKHPGPNDLTAATIVNTWGEQSIADVLYGWGEERYARRIAKALVERRMEKPFTTSAELGEVIKAAVPARYRFGRLHPATKSFQALRIAVNDELGALKAGIRAAWEKLEPHGRIAVITFHSVEDREVKRLFVELVAEGGRRVYKKALKPSAEEIQENPRARSAKLRVIEKL